MKQDCADRQALHSLCQQLGRHAAALERPAQPFQASPRPYQPLRGLVLALPVLSLAALALLAWPEPEPAPEPGSGAQKAWLHGNTAASSVVGGREAPWAHPPPPMPQAAENQTPALDLVQWRDHELSIVADQQPLRLLAQRLAQTTNSRIEGLEHIDPAWRVTLRARYGDAEAAWHGLLRDRAAYGIQCQAGACRLWITGGLMPRPRPSLPNAQLPGRAMPSSATPEVESQPDGSC